MRNKTSELVISDTNSLGQGIAIDHLEREVVVDYALLGEHVRYVKRRRGRGYAEEILSAPSPLRVPSFCPHFTRCGGCKLQHMAHEAQLSTKESWVLSLLRAEGVEPSQVAPPLAMPEGERWRHRARISLRHGKHGMLMGFRMDSSSYIVKMMEEGCALLHPIFNDHYATIHATLASLDCKELPMIEVSVGDSEGAFILRHMAPLSASDHDTLLTLEEKTHLRIWLQPKGLDSVHPLRSGDNTLSYSPYPGVRLSFLPFHFIQANLALNRKLVQRAIDWLSIAPGDRVVDAFSGLGNFSLPLAKAGADVTGLELEASMVDYAALNAKANGLEARFAVRDLFRDPSLPDLCNTLLVDPPRSGAEALLGSLPTTLKRVLYVSCNPETLAFDAKRLIAQGFRLERLAIADLFVHTLHVETIALFTR